MAQPAPTIATRPRRRWYAAVAILAALVVVALGAFAFKDRFTGSVGPVQVGDCFDQSGTVDAVQHHPCTEGHGAEASAIVLMPDDAAASYPASAAFDDFATAHCGPAFTAYTGHVFEQDPILVAGYLVPVPDAWARGERTMVCYVRNVDGLVLTHSVRSLAP